MRSRPLVAPLAVVLAQGASRTSPSAYRVRLRPYVGQIVRCKRWAWYHRRCARAGKPANVVTTAIARELSGFIWVYAAVE